MKPIYTTRAKAHGGRAGQVESDDGLLKLDLALPTELGGKGGATNPEQLFAAGYAACFENAMRHVARREKISFSDATVEAEVSLSRKDDGAFALGVALHAHVTGASQPDAERIVAAAHLACPYSNAVRGNIDVAITATTG